MCNIIKKAILVGNEKRWKLIKNINSGRHATGEYFKRTHTHAPPAHMDTSRTQQLKISPGPYPRERMVSGLSGAGTTYLKNQDR